MTTLEWQRDIEERPCEVIHPGKPYCGFRHLWPGKVHYLLDGEEISEATFERLKDTFEDLGRLAAFLQKNFPGQIKDEKDIDYAIRLLGDALKDYEAMREFQAKFIAADGERRRLRAELDALKSNSGMWQCALCRTIKKSTDFRGGFQTSDGKMMDVCQDCYAREFHI